MSIIAKGWRAAPWHDRIAFVIEAIGYLAAVGVVGAYVVMLVWNIAGALL